MQGKAEAEIAFVLGKDIEGMPPNEQELIDAMVANPKLIERPVVIAGGRAALGRPPESVLDLFK